MSAPTATAGNGNGSAVADRVAGRLFTLVIAAFGVALVGAGMLDAAGLPQGSLDRAALGVVAAAAAAAVVSRAWSVAG